MLSPSAKRRLKARYPEIGDIILQGSKDLFECWVDDKDEEPWSDGTPKTIRLQVDSFPFIIIRISKDEGFYGRVIVKGANGSEYETSYDLLYDQIKRKVYQLKKTKKFDLAYPEQT